MSSKATLNSVDIEKIVKMLPHRYPMLMIDKVKDIVSDSSAVGIKNVTANEQYFSGHFQTKWLCLVC